MEERENVIAYAVTGNEARRSGQPNLKRLFQRYRLKCNSFREHRHTK
jgi:hypothetical protein